MTSLRIVTVRTIGPDSLHSGPSEPFTRAKRQVRVIVSRLRGRAVQRASHDSEEFGAFCFGPVVDVMAIFQELFRIPPKACKTVPVSDEDAVVGSQVIDVLDRPIARNKLRG